MGKLFNLKEWLTVADAARHLSIAFGEDVTEADVLRLALDKRLRLSVYFVNHAKARGGKVARYTEAELVAAIQAGKFPDDLEWMKFPKDFSAAMRGESGGEEVTHLMSLRIDDDRYFTLGDNVITLQGVWDLPMVGNERLDVEHQYQNMTDGPAVTLQGLDGAFVEGQDGQIFQLQESYDRNEYMDGSSAQLENLKQHIALNDIQDDEAQSLLSQHKGKRNQFLEKMRVRPDKENYYPAGGLPEDAVIVVRTEALREFERHGNDAPSPTSRIHVSDKLAKLNQASVKFWSNADRDDRGTHPENAKVTAWLEKQGFSSTLADKAATIIRPEWAFTGRRPEEQ